MASKRSRGRNKGYPKRILKKYGPSHAASSAATESTMSSTSEPPASAAPPLPDASSQADTHQDLLKRTSAGTDQAPQNKPEKRPEPQSVAEFVDAFYAGRTKVLSDATRRRLKSTTASLDAGARGDLLRMAIDTDETLDKTRRLLLLASEVNEHKVLGDLLLDFAANVVGLHPAVRTNGLSAHLFPVHGDEYDLEDAWQLLKSLELPKSPATPADDDMAPNGAASGQEPDVDSASSEADSVGRRTTTTKAKSAARAAQQVASKARRNALLCSVVWRVYRNKKPFSEAMRGLRGTLFSPGSNPTGLEAALLEAIASMPEKEDSKVALLLQWSARQQDDLWRELTKAKCRNEALTAQGDALDLRLSEANKRIEALDGELQVERASKEALDRHIGVVKTHGQADYEGLRASSLKAIRDAVQQLEQVSVALGRDIPKVAFAREVLDTIVDSLRGTTKKLEDA